MANLLLTVLLMCAITVALGTPLRTQPKPHRPTTVGKAMRFFIFASRRLNRIARNKATITGKHLLLAALLKHKRKAHSIDVRIARTYILRALRESLAIADHRGVKVARVLARKFPKMPMSAAARKAKAAKAKQAMKKKEAAKKVAPGPKLPVRRPVQKDSYLHTVLGPKLSKLLVTLQVLGDRIGKLLASRHHKRSATIPADEGYLSRRDSGAEISKSDNQFRDDNAALVDQAADVMDVLDKNKDVEAVAIDKETTAEHDQDNMVSRQEDNDAMSPDTEADKQEDMLGGITAEADNLDDIADDDDDEAILMKDNELDDALNDFDYANLSNNMDSYGEDEEENLAGEDNLEQGDIQAENYMSSHHDPAQ